MKDLFPGILDDEPIAIVEEYHDEQAESWESCVSAGVIGREHKDDAQWYLGAVATIAEKNFDKWDKIDEFKGVKRDSRIIFALAKDINLNPITLRRYKSVFISLLSLTEVKEEDLTLNNIPNRPFPRLAFSHLSEVVSFPDDKKRELLENAEDGSLSVLAFREKVSCIKNGEAPDMFKESLKQKDDLKFLEQAFVKVDHEKKTIWLHRAYK